MPRYGGDWPLVKDMVAANQRLIVFTSDESKEESEGIAYKGNFMIECKCKETDINALHTLLTNSFSVSFIKKNYLDHQALHGYILS